jgi:iodotyrosine deiodinase
MLEPLPAYREYPQAEMVDRAMAFYGDLVRRRTVRDFDTRPVPRQVIEACLLAAGTAPSGANQQPWFFSVITDPEHKRRVRKAAEAEERSFYQERAPQEWAGRAGAVGHRLEQAIPRRGTGADRHLCAEVRCAPGWPRRRARSSATTTCRSRWGIASGLLIAALHHAGLATLTHTPNPMSFLNTLCGRPGSEKAVILLVVGYPKPGCQVPVHGGIKKPLDQIAAWL